MNADAFRDQGTPLDGGDVHPSEGGCWFCHRETPKTHFSYAFDVYYHRECAEKVGVAEATDPVLAYERDQR